MSNVILVKDGRIRFNPNIESATTEPYFMRLEDWITPKGLILPVARAAIQIREHMLDPLFIPDIFFADETAGIFIDIQGRLTIIELTLAEEGKSVRLVHIARPVIKHQAWATSRSKPMQQSAFVLMNFYEDLSDVVEQLNGIEPMLMDGYEEWDYEALVKHVRAEVERQFPDNPQTTPGG